ncbi:D-alanyl-D-alanine carboxypeptidase/D-alanyl-D-alanine endopeptidase [Methanofollis fontis]|uniref:D-alanyl-D-alanine carboxypeptidase/D-alanyl-D-alanine-endopeptidase n=1 Tax=Methanofollis fontis TaxID=2052832 RepID=A0A483CYW5_9EURY|nr:D-alanyl-D-alanine carboxypeptidase/D-alanyl-D-alanine-endopeptidase [Methanofollis fontis]TAJ45462.1 D-alanyl-D-alanine carboxypeptidase/D-alanyl-D-alanine-endopeptidase [Methanofollis fontis]
MPIQNPETPFPLRSALLAGAVLVVLLFSVCGAGCTGTPPPDDATTPETASAAAFKEQIDAVISQERYAFSTWGMMVRDTATGDVLLAMNEDQLFTPGSTTKVFTVSTALQTLGPDYRFSTPVYRAGDDLVLVASGDLAMGGRAGPDGTLEFTDMDHGDAGAFGGCVLTAGDPLGGLDDLAGQVADAGITTADDVIIDDRLFEETKLAAEGLVTPIVVNDNLIDVTITPGREGEAATIDWRPRSSAYTVECDVTTTAAGSAMTVTVPEYTGQPVIRVSGTVPADAGTVNLTSNVAVPAAFARGLFIDALERAGVAVAAPATGENPSADLPATYGADEQVAKLVSPPFSEYAKVTLKVSQNLYANCLLGIIAAHAGYDTVDAGLFAEGAFLESAGVNPDSLLLADGEGSIKNRISPLAATDLAVFMAGSENYEPLFDAMPILGVDGTLAGGAEPGDPGYGVIHAKTGTSIAGDMKGRLFVYARGLLGYMTTAKGTPITFVIYVNNVPGLESMEDLGDLVTDVNRVAVLIYENL